jgi:hypothetical protein
MGRDELLPFRFTLDADVRHPTEALLCLDRALELPLHDLANLISSIVDETTFWCAVPKEVTCVRRQMVVWVVGQTDISTERSGVCSTLMYRQGVSAVTTID